MVLLGAPGCGKGTQGHRLAKHYKIPEISTGDLLREAVAAGSPLGKAAKAVMDAGQLVSDDIVLGVIRHRLGKGDAQNGFILDGFPRNLAQAEQLDDLLDQLGQPIDLALVIDVDVDVILQRLLGRRTCASCGASYNIFSAPPRIDDSCDECGGRLKQRADDNEETIGNRLRIYELQTAPVVQRYREQNRLRVVQGLGEIGDVFNAVMKAIDEARLSFSDNRSAAIRRAVERTQLAPPETGAKGSAKASTPATGAGKMPASVAKKGADGARSRQKPPANKPAKKKATGKQPSANRQAEAAVTAGKTPVKKTPAAKKAAPGKKIAAKTGAAKKPSVAGKSAAVTKKATVKKKPVAKKPVAKKTSAGGKKAAANKPLAKKTVVKKKRLKKAPAAKQALSRKKSQPKKNPANKKTAGKKKAR